VKTLDSTQKTAQNIQPNNFINGYNNYAEGDKNVIVGDSNGMKGNTNIIYGA
jgi:hypothetical protein